MEREVGVTAAEARNEMVLESPDGPFGGIAAVDACWDKFKLHAFLSHKVFEDGGAFIVKSL
jgi:hypothetical protein